MRLNLCAVTSHNHPIICLKFHSLVNGNHFVWNDITDMGLWILWNPLNVCVFWKIKDLLNFALFCHSFEYSSIHSLRVCVHEMAIKLAVIQRMGGAEGIDSNAAPNLIIQFKTNIRDRHRASRTTKSSINFPIATDLNDKSFRMFFFSCGGTHTCAQYIHFVNREYLFETKNEYRTFSGVILMSQQLNVYYCW